MFGKTLISTFSRTIGNSFQAPFMGVVYTTLGSKTGVEVSTATISREVHPGVTGAISITSGTGTYAINGGTPTSAPGTLVDTDYIEAIQTSSASYETDVELVFSIDGSPDTFTVTTRAETVYAKDPDGNDMIDPDGNLVEDF